MAQGRCAAPAMNSNDKQEEEAALTVAGAPRSATGAEACGQTETREESIDKKELEEKMNRIEHRSGGEPPGAPWSNDEAWVNNPVPQFRCG